MDKYDKVTVTVRTQSGRCFPNHNREIIVIFFAVSDRSTEKKWEEQRMRNLKKALCGIMTGMMISTGSNPGNRICNRGTGGNHRNTEDGIR